MHSFMFFLWFTLAYSAKLLNIKPTTYSASEEKGEISLTFNDDQFEVTFIGVANGTEVDFQSMHGTSNVVIPWLEINCKDVMYEIFVGKYVIVAFKVFETEAELDTFYRQRNLTIGAGKDKIVQALQKGGGNCIKPMLGTPKDKKIRATSFLYDPESHKIKLFTRLRDITNPNASTVVTESARSFLLVQEQSGMNAVVFIICGIVGLLINSVLVCCLCKKMKSKPEATPSKASTDGRALE